MKSETRGVSTDVKRYEERRGAETAGGGEDCWESRNSLTPTSSDPI